MGEGNWSFLTLLPASGVEVICGERGAIGEDEVMGVPIAEGGGDEGDKRGGIVSVLEEPGVGEKIVWLAAGSANRANTKPVRIPIDEALRAISMMASVTPLDP